MDQISEAQPINPDNRTVTYDPLDRFQYLAKGESTTDTFRYTLIDDDGSISIQEVTVTVIGRNDDPILKPDRVTVFESGVGGPDTAVGNALSNDRDVDRTDVLNVIRVSSDDGAFEGGKNRGSSQVRGANGGTVDGRFGTLQITKDGQFVYTVNSDLPEVRQLRPGESRVDTFTYLVSDGNGGRVEAKIRVTVKGADGASINGTQFVGGSSILEGFRFAEPGGLLNQQDDSGTPQPFLTMMPTYSGTTAPGTVLTIRILGPNGEYLPGGTQTVVADLSGNWVASFSGLVMDDSPHYIELEERPPVWDTGVKGIFRTFFSPAINGSYMEFEQLSVESIFGRRLATVAMEEINDTNRHPNGSNQDWRSANGMP